MKTIWTNTVCKGVYNKKLIRRWDSKRELSLRRHRTRTTKYNILTTDRQTDGRRHIANSSRSLKSAAVLHTMYKCTSNKYSKEQLTNCCILLVHPVHLYWTTKFAKTTANDVWPTLNLLNTEVSQNLAKQSSIKRCVLWDTETKTSTEYNTLELHITLLTIYFESAPNCHWVDMVNDYS